MIKALLKHLIAVPEGLDVGDRIYVRLLYLCPATISLMAPLFFVGAFTDRMDTWHRLALLIGSVIILAFAYALHRFIYWMHWWKLRLMYRLGLV